MDNLQNYSDKAIELLMGYGPKLILAFITLIIGLWVIKLFLKGLGKKMERSKTDLSLQRFLLSLIGIILKVMLVIILTLVLLVIGCSTGSESLGAQIGEPASDFQLQSLDG